MPPKVILIIEWLIINVFTNHGLTAFPFFIGKSRSLRTCSPQIQTIGIDRMQTGKPHAIFTTIDVVTYIATNKTIIAHVFFEIRRLIH